MKFDFKGQTAVVTGGTRGIGRAVSEAFLKAGAKVIATYRSNDEEAQKFIETNSAHAEYLDIHKFDVTHYDKVETFFKEVESKHGALQIVVVNNISPVFRFHHTDNGISTDS